MIDIPTMYTSAEAAIKGRHRATAEALLREMIKRWPVSCMGLGSEHCEICPASVRYGKNCTAEPLHERMAFAREQLNKLSISEKLDLI